MRKMWLFSIALIALGAIVAILVLLYSLPLDSYDRSPVQPIAFSHKVHAGVYRIECLYCHRSVPRSTIAGIPAVAHCRECHQILPSKDPEIEKISSYWGKKTPIPWVRVYYLPDHVRFPHMMHFRARVACSNCHGNVAAMDRVTRTAGIRMGWCLDCHRLHKASIDCWSCHI